MKNKKVKFRTVNELRQMFLEFFKEKEHLVEKSYNLIPKDDDSTLLIGAGMAPLKKYFTGVVNPPSKRMSTSQNCIRIGDIENVGSTDRHLTFFEMLGNFSFGDYFKYQSLKWGLEFLIDEIGLQRDRLWATIYHDDDETYDIWVNELGFSKDKIVRLGKEDNFWEIGLGPCGPCSEIYYDRGEKYSCSKKGHKPGCDCDQFMEIWNHVFTQYDRLADGTYKELKNKNIDTGMGLERLAVIVQDVDNVFEIDTFKKIIEKIVKLTKNDKNKKALRIIADHIRAITFMIADGVLPSNESRGYVLRKLIRRASLQLIKLGYDKKGLTKIAKEVVKQNSHYKLLKEREDFIYKTLDIEEEKFNQNLKRGLNYIDELLKGELKGQKVFSGKIAFKLYDTFGYPIDLTKEIANENGLTVDEEEFNKQMQSQRERAKAAITDSTAWPSEIEKEISKIDKTEFSGYENALDKAELVFYFNDGKNINLIFDKTPFYPEGGGQVGDRGTIESKDFFAKVVDTKKIGNIIFHKADILKGEPKKNKDYKLLVDIKRRKEISKNHTATHLLNQALVDILGDNVFQAGSLVDEDKLRFDFTHHEGLNDDIIEQIESVVNDKILLNLAVNSKVMELTDAKKIGARALFNEKYEDKVRVVKVEDFSTELCGGIHVHSSSEIGIFKIVSEKAIASGVRRIEAITGKKAFEHIDLMFKEKQKIKKKLKIQKGSYYEDILKLDIKHKELIKEYEKLKNELSNIESKEVLENYFQLNGANVYFKVFDGLTNNDLKSISDKIIENDDKSFTLFISIIESKIILLSASSDKAVKLGYKSGIIISNIAKMLDGGGGGRDKFASAGAKNIDKVEKVKLEIKEILEKILMEV